MLIGFAFLFGLLVTYLLRFELRFLTPLQPSWSMIFDSYGLLSPKSRNLDRDSIRGQRYLRLQLSRTR
jgi:hypothetical protein